MQVKKRLTPECISAHLCSIVGIQSDFLLGYILNCGAISGTVMTSPLATTFCLLEYEIFRKIVLRVWRMDFHSSKILLTMDGLVGLLKPLADRKVFYHPNHYILTIGLCTEPDSIAKKQCHREICLKTKTHVWPHKMSNEYWVYVRLFISLELFISLQLKHGSPFLWWSFYSTYGGYNYY